MIPSKIEECHRVFIAWMQKNFGQGQYCQAWPCWNWRIKGTLVTFWFRAGMVRVYYYSTRRKRIDAVDLPVTTEACREHLLTMKQEKA